MAIKQKFVIKTGLDVTDSAVFRGAFQIGNLRYTGLDDSAGAVMRTDGAGNLSLSKLRINDLSGVNLQALEEGGLLIYDSATEQFVAGNNLVGINVDQDGGFY
jgi:non-ribosomal peptide synthetase component E (peptide arylation enzyme)